jgi:nicotinamide-nucleotide amidase
MDIEVVFIGTKFLYNKPLREYALRNIEKSSKYPVGIKFYKDNENSLFLELEKIISSKNFVILISSRQNYPTIGKIISTITEDNLVLKENSLIPSKAEIYEERSYLLNCEQTFINVIELDETKKMPSILLNIENESAVMQLFGEDESSAKILLDTLSDTYDVKLEFVTLIDGWLEIHIKSKKHGDISKFISSAKQLLPKKIIPSSNIASYIIERLSSLNKTVTFAESCTGGLLTYFFTKQNGASNILNGSLVTYANHIKSNWLAVDEEALKTYGAVSSIVVEQMSEGAMGVSGADYAISISGIAGDGGGTVEKPVGTVFIGIRTKNKHFEEHIFLKGDRNYIQYQSVLYAIKLLVLSDIETFF